MLITDAALLGRAKQAWRSVFTDREQGALPVFRPHFARHTVLYPSDYSPYDEQWNALAAAARAIGEDRAFIHDLESPAADGERFYYDVSLARDCEPPFEELQTLGWLPILRMSVYSPYGSWGGFGYEMEVMLFAEPDQFISRFDALLPGSTVERTTNFFRDHAKDLGISPAELIESKPARWIDAWLAAYLDGPDADAVVSLLRE